MTMTWMTVRSLKNQTKHVITNNDVKHDDGEDVSNNNDNDDNDGDDELQ